MHSWKQYHGNGPNQGLMRVHTPVVSKFKWVVEVGKIGWGVSPVIDQDGIIYMGTLSGDLIAVNPDGTIKWKRAVTTPGNPDYPGIITGSPAIDNDGNIYIITTVNSTLENRRDKQFNWVQIRRSSLHSFTPAGNRRWSYRFPSNTSDNTIGAYTNSSPKVWGDQNIFIFVQAIYVAKTSRIEILVINKYGNLVNKNEIINYPSSHITSDRPCFTEEKISSSGLNNIPKDFDVLDVENAYDKIVGWPEPTLSIVDFEPHMCQPIVVIEDNHKTLAAYRWSFPVLSPLWINQSDRERQRTSPAIFQNGKILLGGRDGIVSCYDLESGDEIGQPWYQAHKSVLGAPVFFEEQMYFVAGNQLTILDSNFKMQQHYLLEGKCLGSVALSANYAYVSATDGLYTFSLNLKNISKISDIVGGVSTPAISRDATVYVIDQKGRLWAL